MTTPTRLVLIVIEVAAVHAILQVEAATDVAAHAAAAAAALAVPLPLPHGGSGGANGGFPRRGHRRQACVGGGGRKRKRHAVDYES